MRQSGGTGPGQGWSQSHAPLWPETPPDARPLRRYGPPPPAAGAGRVAVLRPLRRKVVKEATALFRPLIHNPLWRKGPWGCTDRGSSPIPARDPRRHHQTAGPAWRPPRGSATYPRPSSPLTRTGVRAPATCTGKTPCVTADSPKTQRRVPYEDQEALPTTNT